MAPAVLGDISNVGVEKRTLKIVFSAGEKKMLIYASNEEMFSTFGSRVTSSNRLPFTSFVNSAKLDEP